MPNTLIRDGYLDSDRVSALSDFDDRAFFRILLAADDAGRIDGRMDKLRSAIFPTRECVRSGDLGKAVERLIQADLLTSWSVNDKPVIQVMRWQRRSGALYSRCPDPSGSFKIEWVEVETRDGKQSFSSTSIPKGCRWVAEPINNPSEGVSPKPTYTKTETETETDMGFSAFWSAYPQGGKESRKQALSAWGKLKHNAESVFEGLERWKRSKRWADGYVKAAHRWLRDEMFLEHPEPEKPPEGSFVRAPVTQDVLDALPEGT